MSKRPLIQQSKEAHKNAKNLPSVDNGNKCARITQGVAKLSTFRIPPYHLKRCSEGQLPFSQHLINPQPKILINGVCAGQPGNNGQRHHRHAQRLSSSSNCLLRVTPNPMSASGMSTTGKRMLSLDSGIAAGNRLDWLRQQQILMYEADELRRQRKKSCWNGVGASYAFLALSVMLSLSVVIGVCLFLHTFVPKDYYNQQHMNKNNHNKQQQHNAGRANRRMDAGIIGGPTPTSSMEDNQQQKRENGIEYKAFAEQILPESMMFYKKRRR